MVTGAAAACTRPARSVCTDPTAPPPTTQGLYLVLVTNKSSNILEDLETLRLLSKTVPEYIHSLDEDSVTRGAFELIFAFDEVISMGHKENITVQQIRQNTDMESHEEKLHKMIIQSKINDTKVRGVNLYVGCTRHKCNKTTPSPQDVMKRKAMEIDKHKLEQRAREVKAGFSSMPKTISGMGGGSIGSDMDLGPTLMRQDPTPASRAPAASSRPMGGKGMQLGKGKKTNTLIDSLKAEGEVIEADPVVPMATSKAMPAAPPPTDPITITVEEKLVVLLNKDGGLENMEVQGTMSLQVLTEDDAYLHVALDTGDVERFQFKTHPNIDKQLYANEQVLGLRDPERPFPTGSALGILKWRFNTTDESLVPLLINCWPSVSGGESYVNIEYESQAAFDLQNVEIAIPLPPMSHAPQVNQVC